MIKEKEKWKEENERKLDESILKNFIFKWKIDDHNWFV